MSLFAKQTVLMARQGVRQAQPVLRRNLHIENTVENALPFPTGKKHKIGVALGVSGVLSFGFALPFLAAKFQLVKATW
ncbi:uncharacterized protein PFL1_00538 [Pseudozyma flocculosa PF-1]|uniref:Cytochrome c oxidase subunit 8, mitochondrial n=1 Tax=Pseudozyma flocculosa TaxID=84751 RepID=A0A5C3ET56_9BASI|nr:uncharacterized protein PFL1_00538 [Pseudozyma flocculosa PF-1]EPQ32342.1 hypothetical protein PFL1_00538 [Pseudozyma flocculosa PF-1]SPO34697.1 related to COX8 - cytochrome-c oxidase chain VIII [Pseudozyma flocculosa]